MERRSGTTKPPQVDLFYALSSFDFHFLSLLSSFSTAILLPVILPQIIPLNNNNTHRFQAENDGNLLQRDDQIYKQGLFHLVEKETIPGWRYPPKFAGEAV